MLLWLAEVQLLCIADDCIVMISHHSRQRSILSPCLNRTPGQRTAKDATTWSVCCLEKPPPPGPEPASAGLLSWHSQASSDYKLPRVPCFMAEGAAGTLSHWGM